RHEAARPFLVETTFEERRYRAPDTRRPQQSADVVKGLRRGDILQRQPPLLAPALAVAASPPRPARSNAAVAAKRAPAVQVDERPNCLDDGCGIVRIAIVTSAAEERGKTTSRCVT